MFEYWTWFWEGSKSYLFILELQSTPRLIASIIFTRCERSRVFVVRAFLRDLYSGQGDGQWTSPILRNPHVHLKDVNGRMMVILLELRMKCGCTIHGHYFLDESCSALNFRLIGLVHLVEIRPSHVGFRPTLGLVSSGQTKGVLVFVGSPSRWSRPSQVAASQ